MDYRISEKFKHLKPSAIREIFKSLVDPQIIAFAAGNPAAASFPAQAIAKISADIWENQATAALQYGTTEGYTPLREQVKARLSSKFAIDTAANETILVSGGQQGLELACKVLCDEQDVVIAEEPSFIGALNAFRTIGARLVGVPLEADGMNLAALETALRENPRAKMIYTIPTFHNPAGITTSLAKRREIYALAKRYHVMILEDNPYGELRFSGEEIPTIKSMDTDGIVLYCGSFSKVFSAGMRVGFVCGPAPVISKMVVAKQVEDVHTNQFAQMLCSAFLAQYDFDAHLTKIKDLYRRKCALMLSELDRQMPKCVSFTRPDGGLFVWLTLPEAVDLSAFLQATLAKKVAVVPGTAFLCDPNGSSHSFRITYSTPTEEQIVRGVKILADTAKEMMDAASIPHK